MAYQQALLTVIGPGMSRLGAMLLHTVHARTLVATSCSCTVSHAFNLLGLTMLVLVSAGVCIMCYVLPVVVHYKLLRHRQQQAQQWQRAKQQQYQVGAASLLHAQRLRGGLPCAVMPRVNT